MFFQSEYVTSTFSQPIGADQDVETFYVQGSWMLNGGVKTYKPGTGVFGSPKVGENGLWELTARYDQIENKDVFGMKVRPSVWQDRLFEFGCAVHGDDCACASSRT